MLYSRLHHLLYQLAGIYFSLVTKTYYNHGVFLNIPFNLTDLHFRGRFTLKRYEKKESEYLKQFLSPNSSVIELGSCLGYISCITNNLLKNKEHHVVLEANPLLIPWIERNKKSNNCAFHIENVIISQDVKNDFYIHNLIVGGSQKRQTANKIEIEGVSFDYLEDKYNTKFETLILDIEGGELALFRTHKSKINHFKMIFLETHPFSEILTNEEVVECEEILTSLGFKIILRDGDFQVWEK